MMRNDILLMAQWLLWLRRHSESRIRSPWTWGHTTNFIKLPRRCLTKARVRLELRLLAPLFGACAPSATARAARPQCRWRRSRSPRTRRSALLSSCARGAAVGAGPAPLRRPGRWRRSLRRSRGALCRARRGVRRAAAWPLRRGARCCRRRRHPPAPRPGAPRGRPSPLGAAVRSARAGAARCRAQMLCALQWTPLPACAAPWPRRARSHSPRAHRRVRARAAAAPTRRPACAARVQRRAPCAPRRAAAPQT
mmetsp:Transcript_25464/g.65804  ORF Transcript_25464/g.65804 Transcript_25464/m.65804 type:complete len:252 (-) Transcript_25464:419-1174(-)